MKYQSNPLNTIIKMKRPSGIILNLTVSKENRIFRDKPKPCLSYLMIYYLKIPKNFI